MNRLSEQARRGALVPVDSRRRLLERRMEAAKTRLLEDIGQASALVKNAAQAARRGIWAAAITVSGLLLVGAVSVFSAVVVWRRRRRRTLRARWKA